MPIIDFFWYAIMNVTLHLRFTAKAFYNIYELPLKRHNLLLIYFDTSPKSITEQLTRPEIDFS